LLFAGQLALEAQHLLAELLRVCRKRAVGRAQMAS
jgi:hypothetical protein